jgi:hypothetical protein
VTAYTRADAKYHHCSELAAAGLWTTPSDLLRAIAAIQQSLHDTSKGEGFLRPETARQMLTTLVPAGANPEECMALGWGADAHVFGHRGSNDPGCACYVFGFHGGVVNTGTGTATGSSEEQTPETSALAGEGLAIMTNSALGFESIQKLLSAVFYLKGWPRLGSLPGGFGREDFVPYPLPSGPSGIVHYWSIGRR